MTERARPPGRPRRSASHRSAVRDVPSRGRAAARPGTGARATVRAASRAAAVAALFLAAGCGPDAGDASLDADGTLRLPVPPQFDPRAVDPLNLVPRVLVNRVGVDSQRVDDEWIARAVVPEGSDVRISITWFERIRRNGVTVSLTLAELDRTISAISADQTRFFDADDYETDRFDDDGDGLSNLAERNSNTSPFDRDDPGSDLARVRLPRIDPADAPTIDGAYDEIWDEAQYRDRNGEMLAIDNLMVDRGAVLLDGESGYRWGAMHDGEALYLIAFTETGTAQTPFGDSPEAFNDDSIDVYVDADDSSLSSYDGVDDRHLILPLLGTGGGSNASANPDARIEAGPFSATFDLSAVAFATCRCDGDLPTDEQIYELRLPLDEFDLPVGATFGFEVHVNDDRDGGERDVKWGWNHPSRANGVDTDRTFEDPSFMGTAILVDEVGFARADAR